jgi:hypothetical protein
MCFYSVFHVCLASAVVSVDGKSACLCTSKIDPIQNNHFEYSLNMSVMSLSIGCHQVMNLTLPFPMPNSITIIIDACWGWILLIFDTLFAWKLQKYIILLLIFENSLMSSVNEMTSNNCPLGKWLFSKLSTWKMILLKYVFLIIKSSYGWSKTQMSIFHNVTFQNEPCLIFPINLKLQDLWSCKSFECYQKKSSIWDLSDSKYSYCCS